MNLGHRERIAEVEELRRVHADLLSRLADLAPGVIDLVDGSGDHSAALVETATSPAR